jgi:hypothetical protein
MVKCKIGAVHTEIKYLFGAHEQHVLYTMTQAGQLFRVAESSDVDVHSRAGLVRICVMNQQDLELIWQSDDSVMTVIS